MTAILKARTSQKRAREIMGRNFFGVEEAIQHFGFNPTKPQLVALAEIPLTEAELIEKKDSHILVAVFPISILEIRGKVQRQLFYVHEKAWYNNEAFANEKGDASWQLVQKTPVADSTSDIGKALTARVMVYAIIGHYLVTGERLIQRTFVRSSDISASGGLVHVGPFELNGPVNGLVVDSRGDDCGCHCGDGCRAGAVDSCWF